MWFIIFFNDTATTEIYTLSLHDALPILAGTCRLNAWTAEPSTLRNNYSTTHHFHAAHFVSALVVYACAPGIVDRKSTRLNSSHANISYAVFCLKKKKNLTTLSIDIVTYS